MGLGSDVQVFSNLQRADGCRVAKLSLSVGPSMGADVSSIYSQSSHDEHWFLCTIRAQHSTIAEVSDQNM